jgi:hypothetical protein
MEGCRLVGEPIQAAFIPKDFVHASVVAVDPPKPIDNFKDFVTQLDDLFLLHEKNKINENQLNTGITQLLLMTDLSTTELNKYTVNPLLLNIFLQPSYVLSFGIAKNLTLAT